MNSIIIIIAVIALVSLVSIVVALAATIVRATIDDIRATNDTNKRTANEMKAFDEFVESMKDGSTASIKCYTKKIIVNGKSFAVNNGYWDRFYHRIHNNDDASIANCRVFVDDNTNELLYNLGREGYEF